MTDTSKIACPFCHTQYEIASKLEHERMRCTACQQIFTRTQPAVAQRAAAIIVAESASGDTQAQPDDLRQGVCHALADADTAMNAGPSLQSAKVEDSSFASTLTKRSLLVGLGVGAMILLLIGFGVWYLLLSEKFASSHIEASISDENESSGDMDSGHKALIDSLGDSWVKSTVQWTGNRSYAFGEDPTNYKYELSTLSRNNRYKVQGSAFYIQIPKHEKPAVGTKHIADSRKRSHTEFDWLRFYSNDHSSLPYGDMDRLLTNSLFANQGALMLDSQLQPALDWERDSQASVPMILLPHSRIGIEDLGRKGQTNWSTKRQFELYYLASSSDSPFVYLRTIIVSDSSKGPARRPLPLKGELKLVGTVSRVVDYAVESDNIQETRVKKRLTIKTESAKDGSVVYSCSGIGYYVFDKKKQIVMKSALNGTAQIETSEIDITFPMRFKYFYKDSAEIQASIAEYENEKKLDAKKSAESKLGPSNYVQPELEDPKRVCEIPIAYRGVDSISISNRGKIYVGVERSLAVYDTRTKLKLDSKQKLTGLGRIQASILDPKEQYLLTASDSGVIEYWEIDSIGDLESRIKVESSGGFVQALAASLNRKYVVLGRGKFVEIWDVAAGKRIHEIGGLAKNVCEVIVSEDGTQFMATDGVSFLKGQLASGEIDLTVNLDVRNGSTGTFSPDGQVLAIVAQDGIVFFDTETTSLKGTIKYKTNKEKPVFSKGGEQVFVGGRDEIRQWDVSTGNLLNTYSATNLCSVINVSQDGKWLVSTGLFSDRLVVFQIPDAQELGATTRNLSDD